MAFHLLATHPAVALSTQGLVTYLQAGVTFVRYLVGAALGIDEEATLLAYLHQTLTSLVSACQRLLPLGQNQATRMLWELKPLLAALVTEISDQEFDLNEAACFAPLLEIGSMRHPSLPTRLFVS